MNITLSEPLQQVKDLNHSIQKFLTYCEHLQEELTIWEWYSDKQYKGYWYISIIQYELLGVSNKVIGSEQVLDTLVLLLEEDFFDSDFNQYSNVYRMFRNILHYYQWEKNYAWKIKKLREEWTWFAAPTEIKMIWTFSSEKKINIDPSITLLTELISDKALEKVEKQEREHIEKLAWDLIGILLSWNEKQLTHKFLNDFLQILEESLSYEPLYMGIIHAEFDELIEIQTVYHKALNILWILICDSLPWNHKLFEYASELFLINIRSEKTHRAVKYICNEKTKSKQ